MHVGKTLPQIRQCLYRQAFGQIFHRIQHFIPKRNNQAMNVDACCSICWVGKTFPQRGQCQGKYLAKFFTGFTIFNPSRIHQAIHLDACCPIHWAGKTFPQRGRSTFTFTGCMNNSQSSHTTRGMLFNPLSRKDFSTEWAIHWSLLATLTSCRVHLYH